MYLVESQKQLDEILLYDGCELSKFGIDIYEDNRIFLNNNCFLIDCSSKLINALDNIVFIGGEKTVLILTNFQQGESLHFKADDEKINIFDQTFNIIFQNVFITSSEFLEMQFIDHDSFEKWNNVSFDTTKIRVTILAEESDKLNDYLECYDVDGILSIGDHIVVDRGIYTHHGVYIGNNKIIHYSGEPGSSQGIISITMLKNFVKMDTFWVYPHNNALSPNKIVERAKSRLGEDKYDLVFNNCEHFANWCCTGKNCSPQVDHICMMAKEISFGILNPFGGDLFNLGEQVEHKLFKKRYIEKYRLKL